MEAPAWVCKKLAEVDPNARIGFDGKNFALVKLYRSRDLEKKFIADPDYWRSRGPVFNKEGGIQPDWDLIERVPCAVSVMNADSVFSGTVIDLLKNWTQDIRDVQRDELLRQAKEYEEVLQKDAEQMTDFAEWHHRHAYKIGEQTSNPIVAKKFLPKVEKTEPPVNRYMAELRNLEFAWRAQGWVPREERNGHC